MHTCKRGVTSGPNEKEINEVLKGASCIQRLSLTLSGRGRIEPSEFAESKSQPRLDRYK